MSKAFAPAAERNRAPILEVLERVLPGTGQVLEIGSGTGQHVCFFAERLRGLHWQPSDIDGAGHASVSAWIHDAGLTNVRSPIQLDATMPEWPVGELDALFCANVIHISPWEVCVGLMRGAGHHLRAGGVLVTYGPYRIGGEHTAPSNARFDASLRQRDPRWGVRDLEAVVEQAAQNQLELVERVAMPANNFTLVFHRR